MTVNDADGTLLPASRINMGKIYTVEHNYPVRIIGRVASGHYERLRAGVLQASFRQVPGNVGNRFQELEDDEEEED